MRAAIYARVSSQKQREQQTIASQLSALRDFCRGRGWQLVGEFVDDGKTAKEGAEHIAARAGLRELHDAARAGRLDVVAVVDVDRFTRSEYLDDRAAVYGPLQRAGVPIAVAATGSMIEWGTDTGDLLLGVGNMQSAGWLRKHRERIIRGKQEAIRRGGKPAGPTPFGYSYDRASRTWSAHPEHGPVVQEIYRRIAAGETCLAIAQDLELRGVTRPRGGHWTLERVHQIARSRTYLGEWTADKRQKLTVPVPALVTADEWVAADVALVARGRRKLKRERSDALLQGLLICGECGARVGIHYSGRPSQGQRKTVYYLCTSRRAAGRNPHASRRCELPMARARELDDRVWAELEQLLERPDYLARGLERRRVRGSSAATYQRDLEQAEKRLARHDQAEAKILDSYSRGLVSEAVYERHVADAAKRRTLLAQQVTAARAQVDALRRDRAEMEAARSTLEALRDRLRGAGPTERRAFVLALLSADGGVLRADGSVEATLLLGAPPGLDGSAVEAGAAGSSSGRSYDVAVRIGGARVLGVKHEQEEEEAEPARAHRRSTR